MVKSISVLGCTGSIGRQTIAVAEHTGIPVVALTANRKIDMLEEQARRLHPKFVAVYDPEAAKAFQIAVADTDIQVGTGMEGLIHAATMAETDCVVTAGSGAVGLRKSALPWPTRRPWSALGISSWPGRRSGGRRSSRWIRSIPLSSSA